jgi:insertion element IS1 protein InsB
LLVVKSDKAVSCPHCQGIGIKVVCNGIKKNGRQNLLCRGCGKQFQAQYVYKGSIAKNKGVVLRMLCRGSGVRDCAAVTGVSKVTVLRWIKALASSIMVKPVKRCYHRVQLDEQWSYVGRKEKKVWMIYAYAAEEHEILAFTMGKRSAEAVRNLFVKLKALEIDCFLTDDWEAFRAVLPKTKHRIGKQYTKAIEGINTFFRTRVRRLMRRTVCFSKKLLYHYSMIKIIICYRNLNLSYI